MILCNSRKRGRPTGQTPDCFRTVIVFWYLTADGFIGIILGSPAEPGKAGRTCTVVTDLLAWPDKEIRHEHGTGTHSIAGMLGGTPFSQRDRALEKPWESSRSPERTTRPTAPGRK